jgi:TorA maturation chaperone TorD
MSAQKRILIVSSNVLFTEVIAQSLSGCPSLELIQNLPSKVPEEIKASPPDVIIVDEAIGSEELGQLLIAARNLACAQLLLMNLKGNDFVILDSHKAVFRNASDLVDTIIKDEMKKPMKRKNPGVPIAAIEEAQARAGMFGFLAALYNQRPDVDLVRRLRTVGIESFVRMTEEENASPDLVQGLSEMAQFIEATKDQSEEEVEQILGVDWTRLFRGISPNYGPTPPYEGVYQAGQRDPVEVLQQVNAIYHENGVTIGEDSPNRPDYIGLELDFLRFLAEREAQAWEQGDEELAFGYADKGKSFFEEHLGGWVWTFCEQALEHARTDFYRGFLRLTKGIMTEVGNEEKI